MAKKKFVVPEQALPPAASSEVSGFLFHNDTMITGFRHGCGEFSPFFRALRDECKILGNRCPKCRQLICPPFEQRCPQCNFLDMELEEMRDVGKMAASPVIVFFAPARFKNQVPFGIGYVFLKDKKGREADTAILVRTRTTQGLIKPGIFKKDTKVKVVFSDQRFGQSLDIFVVPQSELNQKQISKTPLMESDLSWDKPKEPSFPEPGPALVSAHKQVVESFQRLSERIRRSPRAQKDLANWRRKVRVRTRGGIFGFVMEEGRLEVRDEDISDPDLIFVVEDPTVFLPWLERGAALTNLVMEGTLWLNKSELETIFRLDRLPRSLRRDNC
jgi:uncharacterized OB-fold protein